jgi:transporter family-2 protein
MTWLLLLPVALAAGMAALSFLVGTVILFATTTVVRRSVPEVGPIMNAPWWMWLGGLLGAFFVCASIVLTPAWGRRRR